MSDLELKHGKHIAQEGEEGQRGGSQEGYTHEPGSVGKEEQTRPLPGMAGAGKSDEFESPVDVFDSVSAEVWLEEAFDFIVEDLDQEQIDALALYKSQDYRSINAYLRNEEFEPGGDLINEAAAETWIPVLDSVMNKSETPENVVAYRGMDTEDQDIGRMQPGDIFWLDGFTSTTLHTKPLRDFMDAGDDPDAQPLIMEIRVPKGTPAIYMDNQRILDQVQHSFREQELLLDRGLKFRVVESGTTFMAGNEEKSITVEVVR